MNEADADAAERAAIEILRRHAARHPLDVRADMLAIVDAEHARDSRTRRLFRHVYSDAADPRRRWRYHFCDRAAARLAVPSINIPEDDMVVLAFDPRGGVAFGVAADMILPLFTGEGDAPSRARALLWDLFCSDPDQHDPEGAFLIRTLYHRVRTAAVRELTHTGKRRSRVDLMFEIAGGAELDQVLDRDPPPSTDEVFSVLAKLITRAA